MHLRGSSLWLCLGLSTFACGGKATGPATVAEVEVVRPGVSLGGRPVDGALPARASAGGAISTSEGGRAWVRLDQATRLLLDGSSQVTVAEGGVTVDKGRAWVEASPGAHAKVTASQVEIDVSGAALEVERKGDGLQLHVGRGEVTYVTPKGRGQVRSGETAEISAAAATVKPAQLWDDWTGGLAWPDPGNTGGGARGVGEIGARRPGSLGEARFPLAITRLEVRTRIEDDLATTRITETFFNPASDTLEGLYRVRIPEGAILQRFAIDRNGRWADGHVKERETARAQYQAQVYEGSTKDPALLEWEAPGSFKARIYPIPAGASRRILVEYSEWLAPTGGGGERSWRYPMASGVDGPIIQELDVEVDAYRSGAKSVRAGLSARIEGQKVLLERSDFRPTADLVVDLVGSARSTTEARGYRSPHRILHRLIAREEDYYLLRTIPLPSRPTAERVPLDLVILTDVSAATDASHLQLSRTMVEALLRHLDDKDRVAVLGADLEVHRPGKKEAPQLVPATKAAQGDMLDALARQGVGGASDLGAVLTQAATLLDEKRHAAVIYVGDALPTVGELNLKALRDRIERLPAPLRLYGVAIGDEADLGLLAGLASDGGLALRVGSRAGAADAALRILGHASRRALYRVQVDLGSGVDRVYPRRPITLVEGQELDVVARVRSGVPSIVKISGRLEGKPFEVQLHATAKQVDAGDDIRLRWASERLNQLLAEGATTEEIAELGVRQNLITPYTSYYVPSADELSLLARPPLEARGAGCSFERSAPTGGSSHRSAKESEEASPERFAKLAAKRPSPSSQPTRSVAPAPPPQAPGYHGGEEGKMGKKTSSSRSGAYAMKDKAEKSSNEMDDVLAPSAAADESPRSENKPTTTKSLAQAEARSSGVLGVLRGDDGKNSSVYGGNSGVGGLVGDQMGEASGVGGLGLAGTGRGGGGTGEGTIGLGNLGTIGKGGGGGSGSGYGRGAGGLGGRRALDPEVTPSTPEVRGSLDKEIIRRIIRRHLNEVKFCYEKDLAVNPSLQGRVSTQFVISATGNVASANTSSSTMNSPQTEACVSNAVRRWQFPQPAGGGVVVVNYPFIFKVPGQGVATTVPRNNDDDRQLLVQINIFGHRARHCSAAAALSSSDRAVLWRERLSVHRGVNGAMEVWQDASQLCELKSWSDRRELLRAMLGYVGNAGNMVQLYQRFGEDAAAQDYLRRAILGQVKSPADLKIVSDGIGLSEDVKWTLVEEILAKAKTPEERVKSLEQLAAKWPNDLRLKLRRIEALEAVSRTDEARRLADEVRSNVYADSQARTLVGEFLVRVGDVPAARRAFSEIVEFAPRNEAARRRLGDLYRAHGWFDEAFRQYQTLGEISSGDDPIVLLLQALAAAGAGRIDQALGLEQRVAAGTEPGSATGIARVALWWSTVRLALLRSEARQKGDLNGLARLFGTTDRANVLAGAVPFHVFLTWAHPEADCELQAQLPGGPMAPATDVAPEFGIASIGSRDPLNGAAFIEVTRPTVGAAASGLRYQAELIVILHEGDKKKETLQRIPLDFGPGKTRYRFLVEGGKVEVQP